MIFYYGLKYEKKKFGFSYGFALDVKTFSCDFWLYYIETQKGQKILEIVHIVSM